MIWTMRPSIPRFQSTPPARGATALEAIGLDNPTISIHAPREGGDEAGGGPGLYAVRDFNPRPPRGGRPAAIGIDFNAIKNFNPRPPRGGRLPGGDSPEPETPISIHAPREGGDIRYPCLITAPQIFQSTPPARGATWITSALSVGNYQFQSTPPARGATLQQGIKNVLDSISIHAPREGGDF